MKIPVQINRGTTDQIYISLVIEDDEPYQLEEEEFLIFGLKSHSDSQYYELYKKITNENYIDENQCYEIIFTPEDTKKLSKGEYIYNIGLQIKGDYVLIIEDSPFLILNSITDKRGD